MIDIQKNVSLAPFTTFHIGGPADFFCKAESVQNIIDAVNFAKEKNLSFFILGCGANILVGDKGFRGLVIKNETRNVSVKGESLTVKDNQLNASRLTVNAEEEVLLTAESGAVIADLIDLTIEKGLSGLEHYAGIPSTLGGALWQNLHFLSPDRKQTVFLGDIVQEAQLLSSSVIPDLIGDPVVRQAQDILDSRLRGNDNIKSVTREYFRFGYDYSALHDNKDIVLSATLRLTKENPVVLRARAQANKQWRIEKHPENAVHCSAGSVFKKIPARLASQPASQAGVGGQGEGVAGREGGAGRFIEKVGLKGKQIGGAKVSEKHANFIINTGNATAQDVRNLILLIQQSVQEKLNLDLQTEISFVGEF